jgi:deoxyribodipyrimidine photo-lyase
MTSILWFRQDLRLADQAAFAAAAAQGPVVPVYVLDDVTPGHWSIGGAQRWWLHHSLASLAEGLEKLGLKLILRRGVAAEEIARLSREAGARRVHALRHYEPWWRAAEAALAGQVDLRLHDGNQLVPPENVTTGSGKRYKIYTPFWNALQEHLPPAEPLPVPAATAPAQWPASNRLSDWELLPTRPNWAAAFGEEWTPGEAAALDRVEDFAHRVSDYHRRRDLPSEEGTARLSPHLHFGEISPATLWHRLADADAAKFRKELAWRDFAQGVILDQPGIGDAHGRAAFDAFPWRSGAEAAADLQAWQQGRTGYPIVDAGMRQLWATGWMHNRVRMVAASFLVKHLLIDWREGARWFWDTLVDADYANNSLNWQWIAGSGADASPFNRIMAPLVQSAKFAAGEYIRRWVPELAAVPDSAIHDPHEAGLAGDYPVKLIGHREARERALAALARLS